MKHISAVRQRCRAEPFGWSSQLGAHLRHKHLPGAQRAAPANVAGKARVSCSHARHVYTSAAAAVWCCCYALALSPHPAQETRGGTCTRCATRSRGAWHRKPAARGPFKRSQRVASKALVVWGKLHGSGSTHLLSLTPRHVVARAQQPDGLAAGCQRRCGLVTSTPMRVWVMKAANVACTCTTLASFSPLATRSGVGR